MLSQLAIPKKNRNGAVPESNAAFDHERLFVAGLEHIERLARRIWTDYNVHDPGITTLELLCYAITDLGYRASLPVQDLLAAGSDNAAHMQSQFFTARQILPNRALTVNDYRKLLIDVEGVQNAWVRPHVLSYFADTIHGELGNAFPSGDPGIIEVPVEGLYDITLEFARDYAEEPLRSEVLQNVKDRLHANRNLCEDFVSVNVVPMQEFVLCCELELAPDADLIEVNAQILAQVSHYLSPPVYQYTLSEMLEKKMPDGNLYTPDRIFDGPLLDHGFITDDELEASELRTEIRLSDIISIIMDIPGVRAVRDILIGSARVGPIPNRWVVPVLPGCKAVLSRDTWRIVSYKRSLPFLADRAAVEARWDELAYTDATVVTTEDLAIPLGTYRDLKKYYSFQNHFPALYGISPAGLSGAAGKREKALAKQLKGYLLFFDQILANYLAQLSHIADLFSTNPGMQRTYFYQAVESFAEYEAIYNIDPGELGIEIRDNIEDWDGIIERRNRFLDHLISRFAERFHDFVHIMRDEFGTDAASMIPYKANFLRDYPAISSERSLAYNRLINPDEQWDTENVSGLERRLAALLGISDFSRHDLVDGGGDAREGMYIIENILLRPERRDYPFLGICPDPNCIGCYDTDPYSYRMHIVLAASAGRFADIDFRRWAERLIREETPAHIQPKICWVSSSDMEELQERYRTWLTLRTPDDPARKGALGDLIEILYREKNIYPQQHLYECDSEESEDRFILGRSALGTMEGEEAGEGPGEVPGHELPPPAEVPIDGTKLVRSKHKSPRDSDSKK